MPHTRGADELTDAAVSKLGRTALIMPCLLDRVIRPEGASLADPESLYTSPFSQESAS
jgi:hypothetical protein